MKVNTSPFAVFLLALAGAGCGGDKAPSQPSAGAGGVFAFSGQGGLGAAGAAGSLATVGGSGALGGAGSFASVAGSGAAAGTGAAGSDANPVAGSGGGVDAGVAGTGGAGTGGAGGSGPDPQNACLDGITDFKTKGPFTFQKKTSGQVKIWAPDVPAGCKVPVVHLANGTGATCATYGAILDHLASHGFLSACYENTNTGQGTQCITALETLFTEYPDLADHKIGSTGHSQGGGASLMCVSRAEEKWGAANLYAALAMEPAHGYGDSPANWADYYAKIKSPVFMFNGSADTLVSATWVGDGFNALDPATEAYWYTAVGAAHIPIPTRWTQEVAIAWFRWRLLGDAGACQYFKDMPASSDWDAKDEQNPKACH